MTRACAALLLPLVLAACVQRPQSSAADAIPARPAATIPTPSPATPEAPATTATDLPVDATYALPGAFAPDTGIEQLERRFGKQNVRIGEVPGAEGERVDGVILFPDDASRRAYLYFEDAQRNTGLSLVRVFDEGSRWHLDNGIGLGTPLSKLVAMNGKPIRFLGLDWDYGGAISDWGGGRLDPGNDPMRRSMTLGARADIGDQLYPMGDGEFASDDPKYPDLGTDLVVDGISVSFPGEDDL
jgi:hypothetical protein